MRPVASATSGIMATTPASGGSRSNCDAYVATPLVTKRLVFTRNRCIPTNRSLGRQESGVRSGSHKVAGPHSVFDHMRPLSAAACAFGSVPMIFVALSNRQMRLTYDEAVERVRVGSQDDFDASIIRLFHSQHRLHVVARTAVRSTAIALTACITEMPFIARDVSAYVKRKVWPR